MTNPMTAEEARVLADIERQHAQFMPDLAKHFTRAADALDQHADMLDRQTVDREAVRAAVSAIVGDVAVNGSLAATATDRILALMPAGGAKAERERLAKVAEADGYLWAVNDDQSVEEPLEDWIRAQGEDND